jgi:hypothetical protein
MVQGFPLEGLEIQTTPAVAHQTKDFPQGSEGEVVFEGGWGWDAEDGQVFSREAVAGEQAEHEMAGKRKQGLEDPVAFAAVVREFHPKALQRNRGHGCGGQSHGARNRPKVQIEPESTRSTHADFGHSPGNEHPTRSRSWVSMGSCPTNSGLPMEASSSNRERNFEDGRDSSDNARRMHGGLFRIDPRMFPVC